MADIRKLKEEQVRLAKKITLYDAFDEPKTIAGCDIVYTAENSIIVISVCDAKSLKQKEIKYTISRPSFPYMPDFLSYREAAPIIETYHKLEIDPDVILLGGSGVMHPRRIGLASHVGLLLDKPTIGITKSLSCGSVSGDIVYLGKEAVGKIIGTKEMANPIYISPGHKISLKTAVELAKSVSIGHKMPEPIHLAHKYASKLKRNLREIKNPKSEIRMQQE